MTIEQLAVMDAVDRLDVVEAAIREERRGIAIRLAAGAHSVDALRRNVERLEARRAALIAELRNLPSAAA